MGLVSDIFTADVLARIPGSLAIGHTRYSTAGDSALLNAQPIMVECNKGKIALAHNGNLTNAVEVRSHLEQQGSIFQTTSDTEVVVHLIARSREQTLPDAMADSLRRIEGAFSLVMLTPDRVFAARDPRGFRPLVMGRISGQAAHRADTIVFASETCAFDLIGATYEREVKPGELVIVGPEGVHSRFYSAQQPQSSCIFEHVYFSRPDSIVFGKAVQQTRDAMGRQLALESPVDADIVVPVPDSGVTAALGFSYQSGIPIQFGLIRNHYVGRTFIEPEQRVRDFGVKLKLNPVRNVLEGKRVVLIDDSIVRGTTSRKIVRMVRESGREGSAHARLLPADHFTVLLRSGHAFQEPADRGQQVGGRDSRIHRRRFAGVSFAGGPAQGRRRRRRAHLLHRLLYRQVSDEHCRSRRHRARDGGGRLRTSKSSLSAEAHLDRTSASLARTAASPIAARSR